MHTRIHERTSVAVPWALQIELKDISFPVREGQFAEADRLAKDQLYTLFQKSVGLKNQ